MAESVTPEMQIILEAANDLEKLRSRVRTVASRLSKRAEISPPETRKHLRQLAHELSLAIMGREP